jgi:TMEM175 potassium channel family protein
VADERGRQQERIPDVERRSHGDFARTEAFSDGVFAIAVTLLVIFIEVPKVPNEAALDEAVSDLGPEILSYFIGFFVIALFWVGHHRFFAQLRRFDERLMFVNLAYLSAVAFVPFATGLFGDYPDARISLIVFAGAVTVVSALDTLMMYLAFRWQLCPVPASRGVRIQTMLANFSPGIVFAISAPVAFISTEVARWLWLVLLVWPHLWPREHRQRIRESHQG